MATRQKLAQGDGEGVDGEVARREVRGERRPAEVGDVQAQAGDDHAPRPTLGVERDERAAEPLRHAPREVERPRGDRHVEVDGPPPRPTLEPGVADCAADEHGSAAPAGDGGDRAQDRDRSVRQPLESENGHGRVSTLDTHDSSGRTPWRSS